MGLHILVVYCGHVKWQQILFLPPAVAELPLRAEIPYMVTQLSSIHQARLPGCYRMCKRSDIDRLSCRHSVLPVD